MRRVIWLLTGFVEKLVDRGINVLRIGNPTRVNDKMLGFTYERKFGSASRLPTVMVDSEGYSRIEEQ